MPPLRFRPILKRIRWGGRRLGTVLGKPIGDAADYAESWEISDHGEDQSVVVGGPYDGWNLQRLVNERGDALLGRHAPRAQFPLLVKFLDAHDRLSLQVHPDDERARRFDPRENGKTEAWVILEAQPGSRLYVGLRHGVDQNRLGAALAREAPDSCLHSFEVRAGDCIFVPAGTVHAIGEGILLAEIQQSSDLTFRLFDWGRVGPDGTPRALHIEEALSCIDFERGPVDRVAPQILREAGPRVEELVRRPQFVLRRHAGTDISIRAQNEFHVLLVTHGSANLVWGDAVSALQRGETVLIPASAGEVRLQSSGEMTVLDAFLP